MEKYLRCTPLQGHEDNYFEEEIGRKYLVQTDEDGNSYISADDGTSIYLEELDMEDWTEV